MIKEEASLTHELNNLIKFSSVYNDAGVRFPTPYSEHCSDDAIVMSYEEGFRFDDKESILKEDIDFKAIIATLLIFIQHKCL